MSYSNTPPENHVHSKDYGSPADAKEELLAMLRWHWPEPSGISHKVEKTDTCWVCVLQVGGDQKCAVEVGKIQSRKDALIVIELIASVHTPRRTKEDAFVPDSPPQFGLVGPV